jgi:hypothetical protein
MKKRILFISLALISLYFFTPKDVNSEPRRILLEFCTGTWCPWCVCGDWAAEQILATYPQTMVIAYHGPTSSADPYRNFNGNSIIGLLGFNAYPTGIIDRGNAPSNPYVTYTMWMSYVQSRYTSSPNTVINVAMTSKNYNSSTRELSASINATALENLNGQYKISYIITENNIMYPQSNNMVCDTGGSYYIHKWLVRNMVNGASGENVNAGAWNQNQTITKTVSTTIDAGWIAENCELNVIIYKDSTALNLSSVQQTLLQSVTGPLGITGTGGNIPNGYSLSQNYPNPFNPVTHINFTVPKDGNVSLKIYDMLGNEIAVYVNGFLRAGSYNADVDGSSWASGVYFYKLTAQDFTDTKKMTLVK